MKITINNYSSAIPIKFIPPGSFFRLPDEKTVRIFMYFVGRENKTVVTYTLGGHEELYGWDTKIIPLVLKSATFDE